ncbi:MAG: acyl-CoA dehydrogenase family protein, partial [Bryobacteraceae bacterium]
VCNVLGEIGRGHIIAFNILNLGRLKLGPFAVGGAKHVLHSCLRYAKERKAFGKSIGEFGMVQHKLAEMAIRIYAAETMSYRVVGDIERLLEGFSWELPDASGRMLKAVEEYATECSFIKVFASEMLDYVVDEGVQVHGGYGFHQDYMVERAYRDSRINRIFEGTNEINRLLATGMLLKRAQRGQVPLVEAVKKLQAELLSGPSPEPSEEGARIVSNAKKIGLLLLGTAYQKFLTALEEQQEILAGIADVLIAAFAMESVYLRTKKHGHRTEMRDVFLQDAMGRIEASARTVLAGCAEGDGLRTQLAILRRFAKLDPVNAIEARRRLAQRLLMPDAIQSEVPRLVVLVGLPGSGKSTWAEQQGCAVLSSDAVRHLLIDDATDQTIHRETFGVVRYLLRRRLELQRPLTIVDATNLTRAERRPYIRIGQSYGCQVEAMYFQVALEVCKKRNELRQRVVPATALDSMAMKLVPPEVSEGFDYVTVCL